MVGRFIRNLTRDGAGPYRLARLIDMRQLEEVDGPCHIVCDIDKTYLETEFESLVRMARIPFESASEKVTVAGATDLLLALRWDDVNGPILPPYRVAPGVETWPRPLHFVSSSPPQLRPVLEEKLMLDELDWTTDTFKNQAYNLRMGRMDLLRHHVAYKSMAILSLVGGAAAHSRFLLIGDNAESDAYIYVGIKLVLEGSLSPSAYGRYLEITGVEDRVIGEVVDVVTGLPQGGRVDAILIREAPGYSLVRQAPFTDVALSFDNFLQAALFFMARGLISPKLLWRLVRRFHNNHGLTLTEVGSQLQALIQTEGVAEDLKKEAAAVLTRLRADGETTGHPVVRRLLTASNQGFRGLSEEAILKAAHEWHGAMRREKEARKA